MPGLLQSSQGTPGKLTSIISHASPTVHQAQLTTMELMTAVEGLKRPSYGSSHGPNLCFPPHVGQRQKIKFAPAGLGQFRRDSRHVAAGDEKDIVLLFWTDLLLLAVLP